MAWWIIPAIVVAVWILSNIFGKGEEPQRPRPGARRPGQAPPRPENEIERFLQEINRRRQAAEAQQRDPSQPMPEPRPTPETRPTPEARPVPQQVRRPAPAPPAPKRRPQRPVPTPAQRPRRLVDEPILTVEPVVAPRRSEVVPVVAVSEVAVAPAAASLLGQAQPVAQSASLAQFNALLRSSQGLKTAILLQEVLGQPRCRRRR